MMKAKCAGAIAILVASIPNQTSAQAQNFTSRDSREVQALALEAHPRFQARLRDYESARFKDVTGRYVMVGGDRMYYICGDVKAKNGFGGYGDWMPFIVSQSRIELNVADLQFPGDSQSWPDDIFVFCGPDAGVKDTKFDYNPLLRYGASAPRQSSLRGAVRN
jgi:hypothetical protein